MLVGISKDDGERVSDTVITDNYGYGKPVLNATFKLYDEQTINTTANLVLESVSDYSDYTFNIDDIPSLNVGDVSTVTITFTLTDEL